MAVLAESNAAVGEALPVNSKLKPNCYVAKSGSDEIVYRTGQLPPTSHTNLASFILESASVRFASKTALVDGATGNRYTYDQVRKWVARAAAGLASLGVQQGDVVLMLSPNLPEFPVVYLAILSLGAIAATSNPLSTEADIVKQVKQSNAKFVVTVPEQMTKFQTCNLPTVLIGGESARSKISESSSITLFSELCDAQNASKNSVVYPETRADDTCTLLFSSGTTGLSKGVELTHRNFMSAVTAYNTLEPGASTSEMDVCLAVIPLYHVYGIGIVMLATLERGGAVVTMSRYSLQQMLHYIETYKITVVTLVPPIIVSLVKSAEVEKYDLSSMRIIATGAASLREDTLQACAAMFPQCTIRQFAGVHQFSDISIVLGAGIWHDGVSTDFIQCAGNERLQWGSVGVMTDGIEARISELGTGKALPPMESGEIWIRGPQVMTGYLDNPEATAEAKDKQGWLHTGDLGYVDNNGYLFIVDRLKEIIKYKAHQVAPGELEAVMLTHPKILDVAVIPLPDEEAGELPVACVVRREDSDLSEANVIEFVGKQVAPYKKVRKVIFIDAIPKSAAGKILRKELIARLHRTQ